MTLLHNRRCKKCGLRLSVADRGELCMFCTHPALLSPIKSKRRGRPTAARDAQGYRICACGSRVARATGYMCSTCLRAYQRRRREIRRQQGLMQ